MSLLVSKTNDVEDAGPAGTSSVDSVAVIVVLAVEPGVLLMVHSIGAKAPVKPVTVNVAAREGDCKTQAVAATAATARGNGSLRAASIRRGHVVVI